MTGALELGVASETGAGILLPATAQPDQPAWHGWQRRDQDTARHCLRIADYALAMGRQLRLSTAELQALTLGASVHDIGKLAIPHSILHKPSPLNAQEWEIVRLHPVLGERMCAGVAALWPALPIVRHHHERWDGSGYPDHLAGECIPLGARIVQLLDVFDALISARPYKPAWSQAQAIATMQGECERGWLDPRLFREFSRIVL
jgi:putative two-component system response regulator